MAPILILSRKGYESEPWKLIEVPFVVSASATGVQTLVCIMETRTQVGTYSPGGEPAYKVAWDVRLLQWPNGVVIAARGFVGGDSPGIKKGTESGYGSRPQEEFESWLIPSLGDRSVLYHGGLVEAVSLSADGRTVATGGNDNRVKVWDVASGQLRYTLDGHGYTVNGVDFSPDGRILASGSNDNTVKLWDVATGQLARTLLGHTGSVDSIVFSPDGKLLASASSDKTVRLWDVSNGQLVRTLSGHTGGVHTVAFSPDGKMIASGGWIGDNTVKLWDTATGKLLRTLDGHTLLVFSVAFSPDGKVVASSGPDQRAKLRDVATGQIVRIFGIESGEIESIAFSPVGKILALGAGQVVKLYDFESGELIETLKGAVTGNKGLVFSRNGQTLLSVNDGAAKLWNVATGRFSLP